MNGFYLYRTVKEVLLGLCFWLLHDIRCSESGVVSIFSTMTIATGLLLSGIVVGIDRVFAATTLPIDNTAKDVGPSLLQCCFQLLEMSLIGTGDIDHDKRAINL